MHPNRPHAPYKSVLLIHIERPGVDSHGRARNPRPRAETRRESLPPQVGEYNINGDSEGAQKRSAILSDVLLP